MGAEDVRPDGRHGGGGSRSVGAEGGGPGGGGVDWLFAGRTADCAREEGGGGGGGAQKGGLASQDQMRYRRTHGDGCGRAARLRGDGIGFRDGGLRIGGASASSMSNQTREAHLIELGGFGEQGCGGDRKLPSGIRGRHERRVLVVERRNIDLWT